MFKISGIILFYKRDLLTVGKALKFSLNTLLFHKDSFSSKEVNVDVAVIVFSDCPCKLEFKTFFFR